MPRRRTDTARTFVIFIHQDPVTALGELEDEEEDEELEAAIAASMEAHELPSLPDRVASPPRISSRPPSAKVKMLTDVGRGATTETLTAQEQADAFADADEAYAMAYRDSQPEIKVENQGDSRRLSTADTLLIKMGDRLKCVKIVCALLLLLLILAAIAIGLYFGLSLLRKSEAREPLPATVFHLNTTEEPGSEDSLESLDLEPSDNRTLVQLLIALNATEEESPESRPTPSPEGSQPRNLTLHHSFRPAHTPTQDEKPTTTSGLTQDGNPTSTSGGFRLEDLLETTLRPGNDSDLLDVVKKDAEIG